LTYSGARDAYSIQTLDLTKTFTKKRHKGIFGFLRRKERKREDEESENSNLVMALDHLNVKVRQCELFGLLGPNGAGKTTLVKCLSTILIPDYGTAIINGFDIRRQTSMVRASLGLVVGGERTLYWKLTARDNLMYFASLYKMPRKETKRRVEELLEMMQLSDRGDERLEDYSTGMRQKIAIARALLHDPPILLLDEPTLGLDPAFSRQIRGQIKGLVEKEGKTVLLATHYMEEADQLCDRVAIINDGKIVAVDTPSKLKAMVKETELVEVACYNPPSKIKERLEKECPKVEIVTIIHGDPTEGTPSRIKLIGGDAEEHISTVVDILRKKNVQICSLNIGIPTLEDVFVKLTGARLTEDTRRGR
jgi:ABC-2 type transport system ATP-binding protein